MPQRKTDRRSKPATRRVSAHRVRHAGVGRRTVSGQAHHRRRRARSAPTSSRRATTSSRHACSSRGRATTTGLSRRIVYDFDTDRWYGAFPVDRIGRWTFTVEAWTDRFGTWRSDSKKKVAAGQDVQLELLEGAQLARSASQSTRIGAGARVAAHDGEAARGSSRRRDRAKRVQRALDDDLLALMRGALQPTDLTRYRHELGITVDRERARFAAWYEMFPRSARPEASPRGEATHRATRHLRTTPRRDLPRIAELGFDVVYLPPIHPIGRTFRKGKNNSLDARAGRRRQSVGDRQRERRPHGDRAGARHDRRLRSLRRDGARSRHGGRARLRAAVLARPSVGEGASGLVSHSSRRLDQVRRESAEEVSGHLSAELLVRRSRRISGTPAATCCSSGSSTA